MALKWLRDNLRHLKFILWGVVVVFVLLVFVDWGAGRAGGPGGVGAAVRVGDRTVSESEFLSEMRRLDQRFSQIYGDQWNNLRSQVDLAGQTASYFIDRHLQIAEAQEVGITVTRDELQQAILENPSFSREDGQFVGADTYKRIIRAYFQMTPEEFEERLKEDLMIGKLNALAERSVWIDDDEVEREFRRQREVSDLDVIQLRYEPYLAGVVVSEEDARAAFERTAGDYRREEQRVIRYLVVETSRLRRTLPVDDAELTTYYEEHKDEFLQGEQANARHILIRVDPDATAEEKAEAKVRADGVATIANANADFAELAALHSEDPGSKDNGGDLGWFERGRMVQEFEDAVFSAKPGEIVGPIESQFGYHIIKVEAFRPEHQQPFEEVEEQVRSRLLEGRASTEAEARAIALARRLQGELPEEDSDWQAIADEDDAVVLNQSLPFGAGEPVPGAADNPTLADEAFAADMGEIRGPLAVPRGWIVWQLREIRPEGIPPFEDVQAVVEQTLRRERALELTLAEGRKLAERWRQGEDGEALASDFDSVVTQAEDHRRGAAVGTFGVIPSLDDQVFQAQAGEVLEPLDAGGRGVVVVKVRDLELVDPVELENSRDDLRARLMAERAGQLMRSILNDRRRETVVTVDNELLQRFSPTSS
jgi:peptidyl-prolyl cis-trans isomerase D